jgi:hypothetical protein
MSTILWVLAWHWIGLVLAVWLVAVVVVAVCVDLLRGDEGGI